MLYPLNFILIQTYIIISRKLKLLLLEIFEEEIQIENIHNNSFKA